MNFKVLFKWIDIAKIDFQNYAYFFDGGFIRG